MAESIIAAFIGAAAALAAAYLANSLSRRLRQGVQDRRIKAYEGLWIVSRPAATIRLRGDWAGGALSSDERSALFHEMTDSYYGAGGGIYLSPRARQVYLKSKENLLCPEGDIVPSGALDEFLDMNTDTKRGRLAIRQLSLLRWILRFDLDIHTEPYNAELTPKEIEFLEICDVDIKKRPFRGNWDRVATASNDRRGSTQ